MEDRRFASRAHPAVPRRSAQPQAGTRRLALLAVLLALGLAAPAQATTTIISTATTTPITINAGDEVDIDGPNGSVSVASGVAVTVNGGTLKVSGGGSVSSGNQRAVYVYGGGTATISDGSLSTPDDCLVVDGTGSTATISDGSSVYGGNAGMLVDNGGAVTISDGSVQGAGPAVSASGGTVTISGGSLAGSDHGVGVSNGGTATISGGSVSASTGYGVSVSNGCTATISGGSVSGSTGVASGGTTTISGGTVQGDAWGVYVTGGTTTLSGGSVSGGTLGVYVSGATATLSGGSVAGNAYGVYVTNRGAGTISGGSVQSNGYGIYIYVSGGVTVKGCDLALTSGRLTGVLQDGSPISTLVYSAVSGQPALQNSSFGPPVITAPPDVSVNADTGECTASNVALGTPTIGNVCGTAGATNNAPTNSTFPVGTTTVTWTVTDTSGQQGTATQNVTVLDVTPPTTTASLAKANPADPTGQNGWFRGSVQVTLSAADVPACSAVAQTFYRVDGTVANPYAVYSGPFTVSGDGQHTVSFYSTDTAGNSETPKSVAVNIDTTSPALTFGAPSPAPNAAGWNNTSVSIPFTASDATSGVASTNPASPLVLSTEGAFVTGPVTATDVAGNTAGLTSPAVKIDKTPPTTTASLSGQAGANGWYTGNVSVTLTATDALSGVARTIYSLDQGMLVTYTYSGPITIKGDGPHIVWFASTDLAGNPERPHWVAVNIDSTKPTLTFGTPTPAPNAAGWNNTPVSIPFTAADSLSGVASTNPPSSPLVLSTQGKSVSGIVTVTDVAGNMASFASPAVKIDLTPPSIMSTQSPKPNANGWNNTAVTITFIASDSLSGVAGSSTKSVTLSQQGAGVVASASFQDVAGNTATGKATANIDLTPPTITCPGNITTTHLPGKTYATVTIVPATATDNLSGVASIVGVRSDGKQLTANYPIGKTTITWTTTDRAGNWSSCNQTITVN